MQCDRDTCVYVVQRVDTKLDYRDSGGRSCMYKWVVSGQRRQGKERRERAELSTGEVKDSERPIVRSGHRTSS